MKRFEKALETISELTAQKVSLTMDLGYDLMSGTPCLKVGKMRVGAKGNLLKSEHIETFMGPLAVSHAMAAVLASFEKEE